MNTEIRALPYPVLEPGNRSCPNGVYDARVSVLSDPNSARIIHHLSGFPFLQNILDEHYARYSCLVAIPITGYRKLHLTEYSEQTVAWEKEFCGEPPMLRPMIITIKEIRHTFQAEDGVAKLWQGRELNIPRGARLALGEYWGETSTVERLIEAVVNENLPSGSFEVRACIEQGFYFQVQTAPDLYRFFQNPGGHLKHQSSILTHISSQCLGVLAKRFGSQSDDEEKWERYQNLNSLASLLRGKGLPLWEEEGFAPDMVATQIYPHLLPLEEEEELDEY